MKLGQTEAFRDREENQAPRTVQRHFFFFNRSGHLMDTQFGWSSCLLPEDFQPGPQGSVFRLE